MSSPSVVSYDDIVTAARTVHDVARRTPMLRSGVLSALAGGDVWLKCENLQRAGSFKIRGAYWRMSRLNETWPGCTAVTACRRGEARSEQERGGRPVDDRSSCPCGRRDVGVEAVIRVATLNGVAHGVADQQRMLALAADSDPSVARCVPGKRDQPVDGLSWWSAATRWS